jgi:hypothetical protein
MVRQLAAQQHFAVEIKTGAAAPALFGAIQIAC